eukprot:TRINITY_DN1077_c0_g1_i5.p1 TRINITY_DN1077_c0_g1~~TRINITY_DN1077_c0_g1_i5.p1  ORF type:complete len:480 (-),score=14.46 TRINITY_DN1077_c0_g1_i5:68-1342(-)
MRTFLFLCAVFVGTFAGILTPSSIMCPYSAPVQSLAARLKYCLTRSRVLPLFLECMNMQNTPMDISRLLKTALTDHCTEDFDKLLEIALASRLQRQLIKPQNAVPPTDSAPMPHVVIKSELPENLDPFLNAQKEFCANQEKYKNPRLESNIVLKNVSVGDLLLKMYVYKAGDIVSNVILQTGAWERGHTINMISVLDRYQKAKGIKSPSEIALLDVGANIGWYTIVLGMKGYKVYAVEPTLDNIYILRKNLCLYPQINAVLLDFALGSQEKVCKIYSEPHNYGNSETYCDGTPPRGSSKIYRGRIHINRLDKYEHLLTDIKVIKMDIEGFEPFAVEGGKKIFLDQHVPFIQTEYQMHEIRRRGADPYAFLKKFFDEGYDIKKGSFDAVALNSAQLANPVNFPPDTDLFMTYKDALNQQDYYLQF